MRSDPRRIIVTESSCSACSSHMFRVHQQGFPELQVEGESAALAVALLADRLTADLDYVSDPSHREAVQTAVGDALAFLDRAGVVRPEKTAPC